MFQYDLVDSDLLVILGSQGHITKVFILPPVSEAVWCVWKASHMGDFPYCVKCMLK